MLAIVGILCVLGLLYNYSKKIYSYWDKQNVTTYPGASLPFGNLKNVLVPNAPIMGLQIRRFYNYFKSIGTKYGGVYVFQQPIFIPVDLDIIRMIMVKDFSHFEEKGFYYNEEELAIEGNLFFIGGERWKNLRSKLTPTFTSGKMKVMFPTIVGCSIPMVDKINEYITSGESVDMKDISARFTTDAIGTCAFGIDCNAFKDPDSEFRYHGKKITNMPLSFQLQMPFTAAFPKLGKWLKLCNFPRDAAQFYTRITTDTVNYRLKNNVVRNDFMQLMVEMKKNGIFNTQDIIGQAFIFFVAGFETSSTTMTHCLMELCMNTDLQDKARNEINKVLNAYNNEMTYECVREMKYLEQCIQETLRKYPALPILNRQCTKAYQIPGTNVVLEEGTKVFIPLMGIHMDPGFYPNPENFDPDRFSKENIKKRHPCTWMPFGEGPRICIGLRFGILQTKIGLIQLLTRYRFTFAKPIHYPIKFKNGILVQAKEDIIFNVEKV